MPIVSLTDWNHFLSQHPDAHLLQTGEWGELKSAFGWKPVRIDSGDAGVQILFRRLPLGFTIGYIPKANFDRSLLAEIDSACKQNHSILTPTMVQTPLVQATGTWGVSQMSGALIGAFVPESVVLMPGFSPVDGSKGLAAIGIPPSALIYIGRQAFIQVNGPGTLFLGINDEDCMIFDNSGSLTVAITGP